MKEVSGVADVEKEVKLVRLRDIVCYHLPGAELKKLDALERDIKVWAKNLLMSLDELKAQILAKKDEEIAKLKAELLEFRKHDED